MHLINQDETTVEVLDARTKNNEIRKDSFIFIRTGSTYIALERTTHVIVLFEYIQGRSTSVLMDDYRRPGHEGYVMSDGLRQYENIPDEVHAVCWVHAERAFKKIVKKNRKHKRAAEMVLLISEVFKRQF